MKLICRHCSKCPVNRPRGLCFSCYYTPGVKERYPSTSKYARRGVGHVAGRRNPLLPDRPTTAAPGTPEKLAVMEARAKANRAVFHPADARFPGDPRPLDYQRPAVPRLMRHAKGLAFVAFQANGKRSYRYFGKYGTAAAEDGYRAFAATWAGQAEDTPVTPTTAG